MILSIGEILVDLIGENLNGQLVLKTFCGGAPFNVAVNAKKAGAKVAFIGRVGNDAMGRFIKEQAQKFELDKLDIQTDKKRNTTLAFVTLKNGERDFSFNRNDTADFNINFDEINWGAYENLSIVHLGSLMLAEEKGIEFAQRVIDKAKSLGKKVSFDLNFRLDIFKDLQHALNVYKPFVEQADIIKFSEDELRFYTGKDDLLEGIESIYRKGAFIVVTLGAQGSAYYYNGKSAIVDTVKVKPIDTTGAGDAFFGALLASIENKPLTEENIIKALEKANANGAATTQFMGAIKA